MKYHRIIIAGGGTGGHIFPALAIANALKQQCPNVDILFVGAKGKMEMEKIPEAGFPIKGIDMVGFNRSALWKNALLPFKLLKSFFQVKKIFKNFMPDAVIGVGGYSTFPVLKYAQQLNIKTFIHEANSFAGKSNILLAKAATKVFVATDGMEKFFPKNKIQVTGNPVRAAILHSNITKAEALSFFQLKNNKKTLLVIGGSLGAESINEVIYQHLSDVKMLDMQVIWQTGKNKAELYATAAASCDNIFVAPFIKEMDKAYAAADVVVARAGAMTVAELCVVKKPTVFVPYPLAAEDHQTVNAQKLVEKKAAISIPNAKAKTDLFPAVTSLLFDEELQKQFIQNITPLAITNAHEVVAKEIIQEIYLKDENAK